MEISKKSSKPNNFAVCSPDDSFDGITPNPRLLQSVQLLDDRLTPGRATWNMAMDQALLSAVVGPVLRVYAWRQPALSFGYFMGWEGAAAAGAERLLVRRWTGGGIVHHGADFTWSLIVPASEPLRRAPPALSYGIIHRALAEALTAVGMHVQQVPVDSPAATGGLCFKTPAPGDLLMDGRKIAGAAQRRCRHGLLHQGSVCGVNLPADFPRLLAAALAETVTPFPAARLPASAASELEHSRYATEAWLRRR